MTEAIHSEFHYKSDASDTVVIFTHGILGSPLQFDYMIDKLNGRFSIENLLLPGHGSTARAFAHSSMAEWQDYVDARVKYLQNEYENIILVGHSMGCLLSAQAAISYPQRIRGLFLIAMPLSIRIRFPFLKNNISVAFSKNSKNEVISAARKSSSISASNPLGYLAGTPRYIELLKKSKTTRELLRTIKLPITVVQSSDDEIVSNASLRYVEQMQNVQFLSAENSTHYYYPKAAQVHIADALLQFILHVVPYESKI